MVDSLLSFFHTSSRYCPRCSWALSCIKKELGAHVVPLPSVCSHRGPDAVFLALLFRDPSLFTRLYYLAKTHAPSLFMHHFFWPFPYFRNFNELERYERWGYRNWFFENNIKRLTDEEALSLSQPIVRKAITPAYSVSWISERRGFGLFAKNDIPSYRFVGLYAGLIRPYHLREENNHAYTALIPKKGLFSSIGDQWVIDSLESGSVTRFVNHSDTPNLGASVMLWRSLPLLSFSAIQDIPEGEELTINYGRRFWIGRV